MCRVPAWKTSKPWSCVTTPKPLQGEFAAIGPREAGGLGGELLKQAYLGSFQELTVQTELGPIFVVSPQVDREWRLGEELGLTLKDHGVTVVAA